MNIEDASREDLVTAVKRDAYVIEQLSARVSALLRENLELMAVLLELRQNGDEVITTAEPVDVTS